MSGWDVKPYSHVSDVARNGSLNSNRYVCYVIGRYRGNRALSLVDVTWPETQTTVSDVDCCFTRKQFHHLLTYCWHMNIY